MPPQILFKDNLFISKKKIKIINFAQEKDKHQKCLFDHQTFPEEKKN